MGIDVNNKEVTFSNLHQKLVNTTITSNPTHITLHNIQIYSIFRRIKSTDSNNDGNPLIYALKGLKGYTISKKELIKFVNHFDKILDKFLSDKNYDLIIAIPSKYKIPNIIAKRINKKLPQSMLHINFFEKCTINDILNSFDLNIVISKHTSIVKREISILQASTNKNAYFTMKNVTDAKIRHYFKPLKIGHDIEISENTKILLIDDLLSTGSSLNCAKEILLNKNKNLKIDGLCLLSSIFN